MWDCGWGPTPLALAFLAEVSYARGGSRSSVRGFSATVATPFWPARSAYVATWFWARETFRAGLGVGGSWRRRLHGRCSADAPDGHRRPERAPHRRHRVSRS